MKFLFANFRAFSLLSIAILLSACDNKTEQPATPGAGAAPKKIRLAYIAKGLQDVYWKSVEAGLRAAEKEANASGRNVEVQWDAPTKDGDRDAQITMVQNYVNQHVDGIILCPIDDKALVAPVELAKRAGIPVAIGDSALASPDIISFIRTDSFKGGQLAAEELVKRMGGKGGVILMRFNAGSASCADREAGFLDAIAKHPAVKIISSDNYAGPTVDNALEKGTDLLNTYKGQVDGVFTPNESSTNGMLLALKKLGLAGKVKFTGFDGGAANMAGLQAGEIDGLILQNPYKIGYEGVRVMLDKLDGKPVPATVDTGATLVTKDNIGSPEVKELLAHTVQ